MRLIPLLAAGLLLGNQVNALIAGGVASKIARSGPGTVGKRDASPQTDDAVSSTIGDVEILQGESNANLSNTNEKVNVSTSTGKAKRDADPRPEPFVMGYPATGFAGPGGRIGIIRRDADPAFARPMIVGGGGGTGGFGGGRFGRRDAEADSKTPIKKMLKILPPPSAVKRDNEADNITDTSESLCESEVVPDSQETASIVQLEITE